MDLPADKAKLLRSYDDEKKWDIICDQVCTKYEITVANDMLEKSHSARISIFNRVVF